MHNKTVLQGLRQALASVKLTAVLLLMLSIFFLVGLLVPQADLIGPDVYRQWREANPLVVRVLELAGLLEVYSSPAMMVLWGAFFVNLAAVMQQRLPAIVRRCGIPSAPGIDDIARSASSFSLQGNCLNELAAVLTKKGYRVNRGEFSFAAVKNRHAPLSTILFHLSFVLLLVGGITTAYTKFRAEADVAVGEEFSGRYTKILKRPRLGDVPSSRFTVTKVQPAYFENDLPLSVDVTIKGRAGEKTYGINRPYRDGSLSFIINNIDVAPFFAMRDATGREVDGAFVKLKVLSGDPDSFSLGGYSFRVKFITDIGNTGQRVLNEENQLPQALKQDVTQAAARQKREILFPACDIEVTRGGRVVGGGVVRPGESIPFDNFSIVFGEWTYWVHFYVGAEKGLGIVYAGFVAMIIALVLRFTFLLRCISAATDGEITLVTGSSEYFPHLFQEELVSMAHEAERTSPRVPA